MNFIADEFKDIQIGALNSAGDDVNLLDDIIDVSLGDHDICTDKRIIDSIYKNEYISHTMYTHPLGDERFRAEISSYCNRYNIDIDINEIMVTIGAGHGLYLALKSIINKDDEVIIIAPYYPTYIDQVKLNLGKVVVVETCIEDGYIPSIEDIKKCITSKTKAIIINSPTNPSGSVYSKELLKEIYNLSRENNCIILSDEVYTVFTYGKNKFTSMLEIDKKLTNTVVIKTMSKDYAMTGWRIGYIISNSKIIDVCRFVNDSITYSAPNICQSASIAALKLSDDIGENLKHIYWKRVEYGYERTKTIKNLNISKPQGGIYLFIDLSQTKFDGNEFRDLLLKERILVLPGEIFGDKYKNYIRITCNKDIKILRKVFDKIEELCNN
ncbi:aminotransferase class I/II-fold pyridoxal phosphate-dependent enzyme [Romboutsia sp. Marseille-P6047]|nr:aminotransferase class I/II-fold pyridoxal phosphate-dependent enzyme [Romboutsia sp. Marseille-P6047]